MAKTWQHKLTGRRQQWLAKQVAQKLRVSRANLILFPAVARALGRTWERGSKREGYALVEQFAEQEGIFHRSEVGRAPAAVKKRAERANRVSQRQQQTVASDAFLGSFEWRRLRMQVLKKRGARCECCGASPQDGVTVLNVDHVKPRKLFPELALDESNLQVLCGACNHGKGNWDQTDWRVS